MEKLYGYKEEDVIGLIQYLKNRKGTLRRAFTGYAEITGKSVGTIRNLYYAIVKLSNKDKEFCKKYLGGSALNSNKIEFFEESLVKDVLKDIFILKEKGFSVRNAINQITNGDQKLALRYQNKYRDVMKNNKTLAFSIIEEIKKDNPNFSLVIESNEPEKIKDVELSRLKTEINFLYERLFLGIKKENQILRQKNRSLMLENARLLDKNTQKTAKNTALEYFKRENREDANG